MAPPKNRRLGYSRRAQYGLFLGYVVTIGGALFALLLVIVAAIDPKGFGAMRAAMGDLTAPISSGGRGIARGAGTIVSQTSDYFRAASKNQAMRAELESQRAEVARAHAIETENRKLKALLGIAEHVPARIAAARLVSSSITSSRRFAVLGAGRDDGIRTGMPVRATAGLVGRVVAVGGSSAQVALLTDGGTMVPVRRTHDGLPAIATGTGNGGMDVRALGAGNNPFKTGDVLVTSGVGGIYAPDIPVAVIVRVAGDQALARPLANPSRIDFAIVEAPFQPAVEHPLAPPPPVPAH